MTSPRNENRRVLIVGLGISGIATALRLRQIGWHPVIVERAPERRSGGYFLALFGAGQAAARRLGVLDAIPDRAPRPGITYQVDRAGRRKPSFGFPDFPGAWLMLRGDVERAAFAGLPDDVEIRYATTPTRIEQDSSGVQVTLDHDGDSVTERFDLLVGADGLRSTVRRLVFGRHEQYLRRLNYMIAALLLPGPVGGLSDREGAVMLEPRRSLWVFPFRHHAPTALFCYRTDDVNAQFAGRPVDRLRDAYGPEPPGRLLGDALDAFEATEEFLYDSVEQVRMDRWSKGRVVLVGDAAWCLSLFSGMGASTGLAGADLLGTMLHQHPDDVMGALGAWEAQLRPSIDAFQDHIEAERQFFTPDNSVQVALRPLLTRARRAPVLGAAVRRVLTPRGILQKNLDIAFADRS